MTPPLPPTGPLSSRLRSLDLRGRVRRLEPSTQVLLTLGAVGLLLLDLAVPDILPFVDEGLLLWLVWLMASTTVESARSRRGPPSTGAVPALPEPVPTLHDDPADTALLEAAEREVEDAGRGA